MARILVVEHDHDIRRLLTIVLEHMGHEIIALANERLAPEYARAHLPDLIVLDISPPSLDGISIARATRASAHTAAIPILAVTAQAVYGGVRYQESASFDSVLIKPFDLSLLHAQVTNLLSSGVEHARVVDA